MYRKIVLAYDGTREGLIALREGALIAKHFHAEVHLLAVIPENDGMRIAAGVHGGAATPEVGPYKTLLDQAAATAERLGLKPIPKLAIGEPVPVIGAYAKRIGADLVVLGHRRQNLLQRWWSGSSGAYVSDIVECSVLVGRMPISDEDFKAELDERPA
jgi:nucleotide-binding universal stress UspA family protein